MSKFLRDENLRNIRLDVEAIEKIDEDLREIVERVNKELKEKKPENWINKLLFMSYVIRFDGKGFRLSKFEEMKKFFCDAKKIERLIFEVNSVESFLKVIGKNIQLNFDALNINNCFMCVQDDDKDWTDSVFNRLKERVGKCRNYHSLIRNRFIVIFIQLIGVMLGLGLSLWGAYKISPRLNINVENIFAFTFIALFLFFSNIWGHILEGIFRLIEHFWPNISFREKKKEWLYQGLVVAVLSYVIFSLVKWILNSIPRIIK